MEQIHAYGARRHGGRWLTANLTATHAAARLGVDKSLPQNKLLISLVTLHIMETFFNPKSVHYVKRINFSEPTIKSPRLPKHFVSLLLLGVVRAGSFDPKKAISSVEGSMTSNEVDVANDFLAWVHRNEKTFGRGNINQVWSEYRAARSKKG